MKAVSRGARLRRASWPRAAPPLHAREDLDEIVASTHVPPRELERLLEERGVPRHELLACLSEAHGIPYVEFDESVASPREVFSCLDAESLKANLWLPLSVGDGRARVVAWNPADPAMLQDVEETLGVSHVEFSVALPSDIVRMIEHNLDVNPGFPASGGRTPLAKVRTFLAERRSLYACMRTSLARGRTWLAILRTHPGVWHSEAVPLTTGDFVSSMFRAPDIVSASAGRARRNVAVISREYANVNVEFGYHYAVVDCYCSDTARNNHVNMRFAGGATDITKRSRRLRFLALVLEKHGFNMGVKGDLMTARLSNVRRDDMIEILDQLGRLLGYTRQLDAVLHDDGDVERFAQRFTRGTYELG